MEGTTLKVNPNEYCGLRVIISVSVGGSIATEVPLWREVLTVGKPCMWGRQGVYQISLYLLLNFALNVQLL